MKSLLQQIEEKLPTIKTINSVQSITSNNETLSIDESVGYEKAIKDTKALIPQILELIKEEIEKKSWDERGKNRDEDKLITFKDIKSLLS